MTAELPVTELAVSEQPLPPDNPYLARSLSEHTLRAYRADAAHFLAYCTQTGATPLPASPGTIAAYMAASAKAYAYSSLIRRLGTIAHAHRLAGHPLDTRDPLIRHTLRGIARIHGTTPRRAAALGSREVRAMAEGCPPTLTGLRDRAVILIGFAGALRRSEIVSIDVEHLTHQPDSLRITLPQTKTGPAEVVVLKGSARQTCPVRALERWIEASATQLGPVFRGIDRWGVISHERLHADGVRRILLRAAAKAGISVAAHETLSPHGLRAGFVTEAYRNGAREVDIMNHTRHTTAAQMRVYIRRSNRLSDHPGRLVGL